MKPKDPRIVRPPTLNMKYVQWEILSQIVANYQQVWGISPEIFIRGVVEEVVPGKNPGSWPKKGECDLHMWWIVQTWPTREEPVLIISADNEQKWIVAAASFFGVFEEARVRPPIREEKNVEYAPGTRVACLVRQEWLFGRVISKEEYEIYCKQENHPIVDADLEDLVYVRRKNGISVYTLEAARNCLKIFPQREQGT